MIDRMEFAQRNSMDFPKRTGQGRARIDDPRSHAHRLSLRLGGRPSSCLPRVAGSLHRRSGRPPQVGQPATSAIPGMATRATARWPTCNCLSCTPSAMAARRSASSIPSSQTSIKPARLRNFSPEIKARIPFESHLQFRANSTGLNYWKVLILRPRRRLRASSATATETCRRENIVCGGGFE